jgi:hypothetical protein
MQSLAMNIRVNRKGYNVGREKGFFTQLCLQILIQEKGKIKYLLIFKDFSSIAYQGKEQTPR